MSRCLCVMSLTAAPPPLPPALWACWLFLRFLPMQLLCGEKRSLALKVCVSARLIVELSAKIEESADCLASHVTRLWRQWLREVNLVQGYHLHLSLNSLYTQMLLSVDWPSVSSVLSSCLKLRGNVQLPWRSFLDKNSKICPANCFRSVACHVPTSFLGSFAHRYVYAPMEAKRDGFTGGLV